jgi:hypothetical protein
MKKSMNSDKFKERYFVLERHHLCYYKLEKSRLLVFSSFIEDKNFNLIILSKSEIRMQIYEDLIKKVPMPKLPPYLNKQNPFIL